LIPPPLLLPVPELEPLLPLPLPLLLPPHPPVGGAWHLLVCELQYQPP
jgi:hypothetical protein